MNHNFDLYSNLYLNLNQYQNLDLYPYPYQVSPKIKAGPTGTRPILGVRKMDKFGGGLDVDSPLSGSLASLLQRPRVSNGPGKGPKTNWVVLPWCPGEAGGGGQQYLT